MKCLGSSERGLARDDRGQTVIDFAIGMGIFLLTVAFVVAFIPTIFNPLMAPLDPGDNIASESASDVLVDRLLTGDPATDGPVTLDDDCTDAFFDGSDDELYAGDDCQYADEYEPDDFDSLETELGLDEDFQNVYVTMYELDEPRSEDPVKERGEEPGDARDDSTTSTRIVNYDGDTYRLSVTVW